MFVFRISNAICAYSADTIVNMILKIISDTKKKNLTNITYPEKIQYYFTLKSTVYTYYTYKLFAL